MPERNPLELVVYPYVDRYVALRRSGYRERGYVLANGEIIDFEPFGPDMFRKRLTDAECAAQLYGHEYTRLAKLKGGEGSTDEHLMWAAQGRTLWRMATTDHYDEGLT